MCDFSFVIPVYNVSAYLLQFYEPFKKCKLSCEIIFVNDGSTDESLEILTGLASNDNRVVLLTKDNGGVSSARNYGIERARGIFISCLDPDDFVSTEFFNYISLAFAKYSEADTFIYAYQKFYDGTDPNVKCFNISDRDFNLVLPKTLSAMHNYPWLRVTRRHFYKDNLFPVGLIYEDSVTVPLLNSQARIIVKTNMPLYYYRVRRDSLTNSDLKRNIDLVKALDILEEKIIDWPNGMSHFYACVAHLSRSALITLFKMSDHEPLDDAFNISYDKVMSKFSTYPIGSVLSSNASMVDKLCFLIIKMKYVGFYLFSILYKFAKKIAS